MDPAAWIEAYGRAWEELDAEAAAELFTEDALYRVTPYGDEHVGRDGVRAYWRDATSTQEGVEVRFGEPILEGRHAAVEWWTTMRNSGQDVTLAGCLLLRFDEEGLCEELREYWQVDPSRRLPPPGWGR